MSGQRGTEKRQRTVIIQSRVGPGERATVQAKADAAGVSISELIRYAVLNYRLPRSRIDRLAVNLLLNELQKIQGEMSKSGSNLNQLTHYANMERWQANSIAAAIEEHTQLIRTLEELRLACLQAVGSERNRKPPT
jgi:hypothetical protein